MTESVSSSGLDFSKLQGKRVLVTGADGFIGSHLTEALVKLGADVRAMCVYNSLGSYGWLDKADHDIVGSMDVRLGDVRDPFFVSEACQGVDIVFHLAALIAIPYSYVAPQAYVETNVSGTNNVVHACREHNIEKCVVTSTSEVYGSACFVPITEEHVLQGQSPYSASKIGADMIALSYHRAFGTPVSIIRPFNTYGPRQSARAVLPTIITQIAAGVKEVKLGDTRPTRDFNYISDTVSGFLAVAQSEHTVGNVTNIASNFEISIGEAVELIMEIMGSDAKIVLEEKRLRPENSEVERLWGANEMAFNRTGWRPRFSGRDGFRKGLELTIDWFTESKNLEHYKVGEYTI